MTLTLPHQLLFGYWGLALTPWLMILSSAHKNNAALIAHEQCHQYQQRRDGVLTFWWRYLTDKQARQDYEVEAYRVWVQVKPDDLYRCVRALIGGLDITYQEATELLTK